jgi:Holliday junction DNA helicase RuvB
MISASTLKALRQIVEFEDTNDMNQFEYGWRYSHVGCFGSTLSSLAVKRYVKIVYQSSNSTGYRLTELGREVLAAAEEEIETRENPEPVSLDGLFGDIIGHEDVKELLIACLKAERPVHVLLVGPPALAKSLFLWDIERAAGSRALWLVGTGTSKSGAWDKIADEQPEILLIDEIDKMDANDTAGLLSLMEGGRFRRTKKGRNLDINNQIRVVAACNTLKKLSPELKSRFAIRRLPPYSRLEFQAVVRGVLVRHEGLDPETADEVARHLDGLSQDVRDAIKAARLVPQKGAARAVKLVMEGDRNEE